ncbi:hypothetical protein [Anaerophaga thermohalophila]|jgi:hypothetical protein|uniref:hypothetical protein n=1 Tax=Anaerophaga thermohalophila TaxID=177400 RepID=UPI0002FEB8B7|nr:hypothetical protein [Anaerophaga thermohalophila]
MKRISFKHTLIVLIIIVTASFNACDDGYRINTKEMIREEQDLMADYLDIVHDTLKDVSYNVIDTAGDNSFLYFELKQGTGDSVKVGKEVGFRYMYFEIARDTTGVPFIYPYASNYESDSPFTYVVGNTNMYQGGTYPGIDIAMRNMAYGTKARIFVLSSLWSNDYTPRVVDLEVTYVEK